jgi:MFS family permease
LLPSGPQRSNLRWLYLGRALRSFATAFLSVVFPLYLAQRHESAATVGTVLTIGSVVGAGLVSAVGLLGDRLGRRPVLIAVGLLGAAGAAALAVSTNLAVVIVASGLGGVGRGGGAGSGGAFGPFFPAEQPLLAASVSPAERTRAFGRMSFIGGIAASAGSLVAGLPSLLHHAGMSWIAAYQVLFATGALASLCVAAACVPLREERLARTVSERAQPRPRGGPAGLSTRQLTGRLALTNALNGFGFGFVGPLLTYWLHVRFGAGPAEVGTLFTLVNLVSAVPYLGAHHLTERIGTVHTVVLARSAGLLALLAMAIAPSFVVAGVLLCVRIGFNSLSVPARQSFAMGAADARHRGAVAAFSALPSMVTSSASPVIGGALMGVFVDAPIIGAFVFMGANVAVYYFAFRDATLPEEARARARLGNARAVPAGHSDD